MTGEGSPGAREAAQDSDLLGRPTERPGERLVTLDFIRGVAVLGILYANIVAFSQPMLAAVWPGALTVPMDGADRAAWWVQFLLIDGKMRGLFALLFGASLALFVEARGEGLQVRRLVWLGLFGLAHYFLLFRGDILFSYAICGAVILAVGAHRTDAPPALAAGIVLYLLGAVFSALPYVSLLGMEQAATAACGEVVPCLMATGHEAYASVLAEELTAARHETAVMGGSWGGIVGYNLSEHGSGPFWGGVLALFESFPAMLIGIGLHRAGLFAGSAGRRVLGWGLAGIALGAVLTWPLGLWLERAGDPLYLSFAVVLGPAQAARLPMLLGLAAVLAWLAPRVAQGWLGGRLVAAGRMALSNYLGMSLVMAILFQGWGFDLFGRLGRAEMLLPVLAGCVLMLAWSQPWLDRFAYGPLEWAWRCCAYGQRFPLRRTVRKGSC